MKKTLSTMLALGMVLTLTACGASGSGSSASDSTPASATASASVSASKDNPVSDPTAAATEASVIEDFKQAQQCWFKLEGALSTDSSDTKSGTINGYSSDFFRVNEPGIGSYDDLLEYVSQYVDTSFAEDVINNDEKFMNADGALYMCPAGRGDDMSISWVEFSANLNGDSGSVAVTIHRQDFFDSLGDWYETGDIDQHEFPFTVEDGHAVFSSMEYICGPAPEEAPAEGHDASSLDLALLGKLQGKWFCSDDSYIEINSDGSFETYTAGEKTASGYIETSRGDDGSYLMAGEGFSNTFFELGTDDDGTPVLLFDGGGTVYTLAGQG